MANNDMKFYYIFQLQFSVSSELTSSIKVWSPAVFSAHEKHSSDIEGKKYMPVPVHVLLCTFSLCFMVWLLFLTFT